MRKSFHWRQIAIPVLLIIEIIYWVGVLPVLSMANPATDATISVVIPTGSYNPGQTVNVDIVVNTTSQTRATGIAISFNPTVLRCDKIIEGTFFKNWAAANGETTFVSPRGTINNTNGTVSETDVLLLGGSVSNDIVQGPSGTGVLLTYQFTTLANGISDILLTTATLVDNHAQHPLFLSVTIQNGQFVVGPTPEASLTPSSTSTSTATGTETPTRTIPPPPTQTATSTATIDFGRICPQADLNHDGVIDLLDLLQVSAQMGQTGPPGWIPEDFNRDGVVDIRDLIAMSPCIGRSLTPLPTPALQSAIVSFSPVSQSVKSGQTLSVAILLDVNGISTGAQAGLNFNPTILRCENITEGSFYKAWLAQNAPTGSTQFFPAPTCDNAAGRVTTGRLFLTGSPPGQGPSGSGSLLYITFTAIGTGLSSLQLTDAQVLDNSLPVAQSLSTSVFNGQVNVLPGGPNVMLSVQPARITGLKVNDTVNFTLNIASDTPTRGAQSGISFDPGILQCNRVTEGSFYKGWAAAHGATTTFYPPSRIDNTNGQISSAVVALVGGSGGVTGSGVFLSIQCMVVGSANQSDLILTNYIVSDAGSPPRPLPLQINNGWIGEITVPTPTPTPTATQSPTLTQPPTSTQSPTATTQVGRVYLDPASPIIRPGTSFDVVLKLDTSLAASGLQFEASFDKTILQCQSINQGTFFSDWVDAHSNYNPTLIETPKPACDNVNGKITLGTIQLLGQDIPNGQGPTGSGTVYILTFKALAIGASTITLANVIVPNALLVGDPPRAQAIPVGVDGAHVTVSATAPSLTPTQGNSTAAAQTQAAAHSTQTAAAALTQTAGAPATQTAAARLTATAGASGSYHGGNQGTSTPRVSTANGSFSVSPIQKSVAAPGDDLINLDFVLNIDQPTRAIQFVVKYNPAVLSCVKIIEGNFYKGWTQNYPGAQTYMIPTPKCNDATGSTSVIGISVLGGPIIDPSAQHLTGVTGTGVVATVQFKAKAIGSSDIQLTDVIISDDHNQNLGTYKNLPTINGGVYVGVTPPPSPTLNPALIPVGTQAATGVITGTNVISLTGTPGTQTPGAGITQTVPTATGSQAINETEVPITGGKVITNTLLGKLDKNGILLEDVEFQSDDGILILRLSKGAQALTADNHRLDVITIRKLDTFPLPKNGLQSLNLAYELGPDGATFDPPAVLVMKYDRINFPKNLNQNDLTLTTYDLKQKQWIKLKGQLDSKNHEISTSLAHLSIYSLMAQQSSISPGVWIGGSILIELLVAAGFVVYLRRRKNKTAANPAGEAVLDALGGTPGAVLTPNVENKAQQTGPEAPVGSIPPNPGETRT